MSGMRVYIFEIKWVNFGKKKFIGLGMLRSLGSRSKSVGHEVYLQKRLGNISPTTPGYREVDLTIHFPFVQEDRHRNRVIGDGRESESILRDLKRSRIV